GTWKRTTYRALVPRSVQEAVQQRTMYLSADAKRLVTLAAVAGRRFNVTLLQEMMRCDEEHLLALLKEAMAAQLVVAEGVDQFARAVEAAHHLSQTPPAHLYLARGQAYETLGDFERARGDYERALDAARAVQDRLMEWQSMLAIGFLWTGHDYERAGVWFRQ